MMRAMIILLLMSMAALAVPPTGTVYRAVCVDTNGLLAGPSTNFAALNGISGTGSVADVTANLTIVSNLAVSGIASAAVAQAYAEAGIVTGQTAQTTADAAMATGMAAQAKADAATDTNTALDARMVAIETNHATAAQGALADTAVQPETFQPGLLLGDVVTTNTLIITGANYISHYINGTYNWMTSGEPKTTWFGGEGCWIKLPNELGPNNYELHWMSTGADFASTNGVLGPWYPVAGSGDLVVEYGTNRLSAQTVATMVSAALLTNSSGASLTGITPTQVGAMPSNGVLPAVNWIDLIAPGMSLAGGVTAPQLIATGTGRGIQGMGYDLNDIAYGALQMPHSLALTNATRSTLYVVPHVHWSMATAPSPPSATNVTWELIWEWANIGGGFTQRGTNIVTVGETIATNSWLTSFGNVTNNGAGISSLFRFRLGRTTSGSDDYGATRVLLDQFDIHVPVDRIGSAQETIQ